MTVLRHIVALALMLGVCGGLAPLRAEDSTPIAVTSGVSYQYLTTWPVERLNQILTTDAPAFFGTSIAYTPARNAVRLYRVTYSSVVPERDNRQITATGLLAVPDTAGTRFPMVSYQHGTVYRKQQVPSFPDNSPETQLMIAQFAGQGYVLIGADYFGMGGSSEPQGFMVKGSHQQATYDMLLASRAVLAQMKIETPRLAIAGWSQGGFVTMAMLEKLESTGVTVKTATASAPLDVFAALNGFLQFPRAIDAGWVNSLFILSAFSYEEYYGLPGMAASMFAGEYYDLLRRAYDNEDVDVTAIPTDLHKLIRPAYFDPQFFAMSAYGRIIAQTQSYRWLIKSPVRNYYGEADEVITPGIGQIAQTYQRAMGAGNMTVEAISTGATSHRGTFATAVPQWKIWFDTP